MNIGPIRILGVDPGLRNTGWGMIEAAGTRLTYVDCGSIHTDAGDSLAERLALIHRALAKLIADGRPAEAAVEETFVNRDPQSALKLGQARGAALAALALMELPVAEYAANLIKKTVVGVGHAEKSPGGDDGEDAAARLPHRLARFGRRVGGRHLPRPAPQCARPGGGVRRRRT